MDDRQANLSTSIAEAIRRLIAAGELRPGDRLPPIREQARRWGCTPGTVSRAYAVLARDGLVIGLRGGGTRVAPQALGVETMTHQWALLVNRAERFLIEALGAGFTTSQAEGALALAVARWNEAQRQPVLPTAGTADRPGLRFKGSHDLVVETMIHLMADQEKPVSLEADYIGSLGGLMALARGEADIAGAHLWDEASDSYNTPFVERILPGRRIALVGLALRSLGLIVSRGNPHRLEHVADLARPGVRMINRQSGSGTRVRLDAWLKRAGVDPSRLTGYDRPESTHLAVAEAVATGSADAGLGIRAAASAYGLDFVPLTSERYDLIIPQEVWESPEVGCLLALLRSNRFAEMVHSFGGYDTSITGQEVWLG